MKVTDKTNPMFQILVPTDFSEPAGFAEKAAVVIGQKLQGSVSFFHGLSIGMDWSKLSEERKRQYPEIMAGIENAEAQLQTRQQSAQESGVESRKLLAYLDSARSVSQAVLSQQSDMIVMGSHGVSGFKKYITGSNTSKILRMAVCPVLVTRIALPPAFSFKTIVFASNLDPDTHKAFERLLEFGKKTGLENLHLLDVTTPNNFRPTGEVKAQMMAFAQKHDFKNIWLHNYNHFTVEAGIIEFSQSIGADLIAIANHGRTDLSSLFIESIPENLIKYADCPLLSIRV